MPAEFEMDFSKKVESEKFPSCSRRRFISLSAVGVLGLVAQDLIQPASASASASANTNIPSNKNSIKENYHIVLPYHIAKRGGSQTVTLRSGDTFEVKIPPRIDDSGDKNPTITLKGRGTDNNDVVLFLHTLYDPTQKIGDKIYQELDNTTFIRQEGTNQRAKYVYEDIEDANPVEDFATLELLDYVISSSKLDKSICDRYQLASQNARLISIERVIEDAFAESTLSEAEKKSLRGIYQYVRASEPVPNFEDLNQLDTIVENSNLPIALKRPYSIASATSRALTVDFLIVNLITNSNKLSQAQKERYLSVYRQVRDGREVSDNNTVSLLDWFIFNSDLLESCKVVYSLARNRFFDRDAETTEEDYGNLRDTVEQVKEIYQVAKKATNNGAAVVPTATDALSLMAVEAGTGVTISSLTGAAATNATLAALGGGSVAAGGLGMLGGLAVATGGAALIGAAGLLSIALVAEMDGEDLLNLGVAGFTGTLAGAGAVFVAWTGASALGVAGTLSGAAAITSTISALGGLSVMTGGAALVAFGTGFVMWSFLKGQKHRESKILNQLESRLYTLTEDVNSSPLVELVTNSLPKRYEKEEVFVSPEIPLDKLSTVLSKYAFVRPEEQIIALIDTSRWNDAQQGVVFTNLGIWYKAKRRDSQFVNYSNLSSYPVRRELSSTLYNDDDKSQFARSLLEIGSVNKA